MRIEFERLQQLRSASRVFDFEAEGEAPERYTLIYRGRGVARGWASGSKLKFIDIHRVALRLPFSFPDRPPDIRWLSPIFHPNISFSGFINLKDAGLPWEPELGLDVICERLWDLARLAFVDLDHATNYTARNWFAEQHELTLPVDHRLLREGPPPGTNVIGYAWQEGGRLQLPPGEPGEVLFIGEDTPTPDLPVRIASPRRKDDDDILYIGPE